MEIKGKLKCMDCGWEEENVETMFTCPNCKRLRIIHTPPRKIFLCERDIHEGHGRNGGKLGNMHKKTIQNIDNKGDTYCQVLRMIKSERKLWGTKEVIDRFNASGFTDGDVIRVILDMLVCEGHLRKIFMKDNRYHSYNSDVEFIPCPFLTHIKSGKRDGTYRCSFNFRKEGEELDSKDIFGGNKTNE